MEVAVAAGSGLSREETKIRFTQKWGFVCVRRVDSGDATRLLGQLGAGDGAAADRLLPLVYDELRRLAAAKLARESAAFTLQPTALVHEVWLRLGADAQPAWKSRAQFFSAAAEAMRRILIENVRRKRRVRHGGELDRVDEESAFLELAAPIPDEDLLRLDEALEQLAAFDPRKAELVKQRYFIGLTLEEAAEVLEISPRTANREWLYARTWLFNAMKQNGEPRQPGAGPGAGKNAGGDAIGPEKSR